MTLDVTVQNNKLHVTARTANERNGSWHHKRLFAGTLEEMQAKYPWPPGKG